MNSQISKTKMAVAVVAAMCTAWAAYEFCRGYSIATENLAVMNLQKDFSAHLGIAQQTSRIQLSSQLTRLVELRQSLTAMDLKNECIAIHRKYYLGRMQRDINTLTTFMVTGNRTEEDRLADIAAIAETSKAMDCKHNSISLQGYKARSPD